MAPLKLHCVVIFITHKKSYHVWKDMAPLKHKFEGHVCKGNLCLTMSEKTWLHWSPYADSQRGAIHPIFLPCLKRHGSIEAGCGEAESVSYNCNLTMSEKTWLHWSTIDIFVDAIEIVTYHVWKDMAPLKQQRKSRRRNRNAGLPCLKRHGSIEALQGRPAGRLALSRLPCLKRHGSIEAWYGI